MIYNTYRLYFQLGHTIGQPYNIYFNKFFCLSRDVSYNNVFN